LLDLNLRIRRSLQYTLLATGWIIAIGVLGIWLLTAIVQWNPDMPHIRLTGASIEITDEAMTLEQRDHAENAGMIIIGIGGAVALWWLGRIGLTAIARGFHRTRYDYRRAANDLAEVMSTRFGMQNLARGIVEKIAEIMHLKRVGILFFRDEEACCCEEAQGFDGTAWKEFCISSEKGMTEAIQQFKGEFRIDYLPENLKRELRKQDIQYLVPIRSKERLVGTILVGEKRSESAFLREDLEFLSSVSRQASVAIENAFLYEELAEQERIKHELQIARRIQLESLPQSIPQIAGLDISGISIPATEVGGDYFDYLNGEANRLTVVVGDVSGKGTSAALYMAKIQGILRSLNEFGLSPGELFTRTNRLLWNDLEKKSFVTAFGASFDTVTSEVVLARAGHLPLFLFRYQTGSVERIVPRGIGLGLSGNGSFDEELQEQSVTYGHGDVFVFITDGITEGKNAYQEEFGEQRLESVLGASASLSAEGIRESIVDAVKTFAGETQQHDDQTVVVVKIAPSKN
ncbi:MAG: SpoIIE family protein phosphatase, partial [Ignavibacteria bacterium]|nr:SpoIIE family protein phosphatase [Ignavibacteria bacterium]